MSDWKMKRFWNAAAVTPSENGFTVTLDGRPVRTPAKHLLAVPTQGLAQAIAVEWDAQTDVIDPRQMPFTRTANAAIDKVAPQKTEVADMLAAYGDSDLLCYRADAPAELVARQMEHWDPMLDWAASVLDARLVPRAGIVHVPQDASVITKLTERVHGLSVFELAAFHDLVSLSGSLILGFAAAMDAAPTKVLWDLSRLDELWQAEQWGVDADAESMAAVKGDAFEHAQRVFLLLQNPQAQANQGDLTSA